MITGWQVGGVGGVYVPGQIPGTYGPAPSGSQIAYTGPGSGSVISQDVGPVTPGGIYTLSVEVGQRLDFPLFDYRLLLGFGGHDLATTTVFRRRFEPGRNPGTRHLFSRDGNGRCAGRGERQPPGVPERRQLGRLRQRPARPGGTASAFFSPSRSPPPFGDRAVRLTLVRRRRL